MNNILSWSELIQFNNFSYLDIQNMPQTIITNDSPPDPKQNFIIAALPATDYNRVASDLKLVELPLGLTMSESGDHVKFVHFPISGIVSMVYSLEDGSTSATALVGNEGIVGISIFMGGESLPTSTEVQSVGHAYRLSRKVMKQEFSLGGKLQHLALLYTQGLLAQTSLVAVCNQHHNLDQQICRWLLMTLDRLNDNKVVITHARIGQLLGIRRASVTQVLGQLESDKLIVGARGQITVLKRRELEMRVCECYAVVKDEYERLLTSNRK
ncbi:Crp/Fnr family transcriptional regulator [Methylicorpusculum oleiharenae]|uniref:Crp/Fnr family transcriptional regulator n=1 Tax=Methylicorpusculum oleiharenae TaxID=1338687 RepID=UPI001E584DF6|nr:Crp/Fnr family transcriptional regulator [Methylicorpusculum oleiharenae]MCD2448800.1 Crp/Fnr family transcriptional regulator [Methylicorpusculum oleiharenae]